MIAFLHGTLEHADGNRAVINVRDVGYEVFAPRSVVDIWRSAIEPFDVHVHTHVREDALLLYGFASMTERRAFIVLTGVSGVGPKLALAALDELGSAALALAVESDDLKALCQISGVGKRTAQRLALELKGKLPLSPAPRDLEGEANSAPLAEGPDTLALALAHLGYSRAEIGRVKQSLVESGVPVDAPVADRLKAALKIIYGKG